MSETTATQYKKWSYLGDRWTIFAVDKFGRHDWRFSVIAKRSEDVGLTMAAIRLKRRIARAIVEAATDV